MPSRQKPPLENPPQTITRKSRNGQQKKFIIGRLLGKGGFARCYQITDASDHSKVYAAKIIQKNWLTKKTEGKLDSEIKIHRSLKHEGVVKLYTQFDDEQFVYIILELCTNQTLVEMLRQRKRLSEAEVRYFAIQILLTVHHLHKEGVIHRDLKLGNLFLNDKMHTKLGDFGLATKLESQGERRKTICGTPNYIAPEIITRGGQGHTFPVDVWSIGCILYTLLVGKPPFQSQNLSDTYSKIKESSYSWPSDVRPSRAAVDLVRRMLLVNAEERIRFIFIFYFLFFIFYFLFFIFYFLFFIFYFLFFIFYFLFFIFYFLFFIFYFLFFIFYFLFFIFYFLFFIFYFLFFIFYLFLCYLFFKLLF